MTLIRLHNSLKSVLVGIILFTSSLAAFAGGRLTFTAKADVVSRGLVRVTFTVNSSSATDFHAPSFADFEPMSGPNVSRGSSVQIINGNVSSESSTTYTYILEPKKSGRLTIGSASVTVEGKVLHTKAITVDAQTGAGGSSSTSAASSNAGEAGEPTLQSSNSSIGARDLYIECVPSRTTLYEQEAVLLTYRIHARLGVGLNGTQLASKPDFAGLISYEIPLPGNQINMQLVRQGNVSYQVGTLLQYVVVPQKSGEIKVPALTFDCTVLQRDTNVDDFEAHFFGTGLISRQLKRTTNEVTLHVEALPEPRPANFTGGVGHLEIKSELLTNTLRTNDLATYRVTLSGTGNLRLITPPTFTLPADFDVFEPKVSDDTKVVSDGVQGTITYDYTFIPHNVGTYTLPAIEMAYFDPSEKCYKTLALAARTVQIQQGTKSDADAIAEMELRKSDIHSPTVLPEALDSARAEWNFGKLLAIDASLLTAFFLLLISSRKYIRRRSDVAGRRKSRAGRKAERALQQATDASQLLNAIVGYVADLYGESATGLTTARIRGLMEGHEVPSEAIQEFMNLMDRLEYARYAPPSDEMNIENLRRAALTALEAVQPQKKSRKHSGRMTLSLLFLAFSFTFAAPAFSQATDVENLEPEKLNFKGENFNYKPENFDSLWNAKNYAEAAATCEVLLTDSATKNWARETPEVHYNLGCCYYRMNEFSRAILAFERAVRLAPANADAQFNLRLTQTKITDALEAPTEMFFISWWRNLRESQSHVFWGALGWSMWLLTLLFCTLFAFSSRLLFRRLGFYGGILAFLLSLTAHIFAYRQYDRFENEQRFVVAEKTSLREAPAETSKALRTLHEGTSVRQSATYQKQWVEITLPNGQKGWLKRDALWSVKYEK